MTKLEFLTTLREKLAGIPEEDLMGSVSFYSEMIDDRMEDGMTESEAVANVGDAEQIARQIRSQAGNFEPQPTVTDTTSSKVRYVLRNPLLAGLFSLFLLILWIVAVALIICLWTVVVSVYAAGISCAVSGGALPVAGIGLMIAGFSGNGLFVLGAGVFLIGFTVLWWLVCKYATLAAAKLTKWTFVGLVRMLFRKEVTA